jgi:predicted amidohydrolase YtcJ
MAQFPHHSGYGDEWVRLGGIGENTVDGGFTGPTAWTLADYKGMPGFRGKGRFTDAELQEMVDTSAKNGWQMALHAIGDAAISQTINAYAAALEKYPRVTGEDHRWFVDHFTIMPPDEIMQKMADHHIMIAQQPNFAYNLDARYHQTMDDWRYRHNNSVATPWKKFGLLVAFGSDNLPIGPMVALHSAVTRKNAEGEVVGPEEKVSMQDAIRGYTEHSAYLSWEEDTKGTLEVGKLADIIVLDSDPLTVPEDKILDMKVNMTFLGGKLVYNRTGAQ